MLSVKPIGDQVLVELIEEAKTSAGGIVLPENSKLNGTCQKVVITELGDFPYPDDKRYRKWPFEVGDFALIPSGAGIDVKVGLHNCALVKCEHILGIVEG
jgi:chaperonin GroES